MSYKNYEDQLKCQREWYSRNKEKRKKQIYERKRKIAKWLFEYKSKLLCCQCDYDFNGREKVCDFHHIKESKEYKISQLVNRGWSIEKLKKEIDKCIPLCANCHRMVHYNNEE